jgi:hypothetical protein
MLKIFPTFSVIILLTGMLTGITNLSSGTANQGGWVIEYADAPHLPYSTDHSLRLDTDGNAHTVYGGDHLYYAWENGDGWLVKIVDDDPTVGLHASLDLDPQGFAHISYYDEPNQALKYAYQDEGGWHTKVLDPNVQNNHGMRIDTSIVVDADGFPHISYCDFIGDYRKDLKYAYQDQDGWHIELVESGNEGQMNSLALDDAGRPYISYTHEEEYYGEGRRLKFAYKNAEGWQYEIVDHYNKGDDNSLAVDANGNVHLSYNIPFSGLVYGYWDTTGWYTRTLDSLGYNSSIALDTNGNPHISYGGISLKYAYADANNWYTSTLELEDEPTGFSSSIAVDQHNQPHIKYTDNSAISLKHGYLNNNNWQHETIDSDIGKASVNSFSSSLILDSAGFPHISYIINSDLEYAQRDIDGWSSEILDNEGSISYPSMVMNGEGYLHIAYTNLNDEFNYIYQDETGWNKIIVNDDVDITIRDISLALDKEGKPHVSYYDNLVRYTYPNDQVDGLWKWETFHTSLFDTDGRYTSIEIDNQGRPHISYYYDSQNELGYAVKGLYWNTTTVDEDVNVGGYTSLELDQNDDAHISYYDFDKQSLKYAYVGNSGWVTQTVDSEGKVGRYTSLDLDNAGHPHISYYDETNTDLKYAHHDGSMWHIVTVDSLGDVGKFTSLDLDAKGFPHISYYDESNQDLKYAYYTDVLPTQTPSPTSAPPPVQPGDGVKLFLPLTIRH